MTAQELPAKWQAWSSDLMANPAKNYTLMMGYLGALFVTARLTVTVFQHSAGYRLGSEWDIAMLLALGFGFFRCAGIIQHLYGYIIINAMDDETFPREHRLYWRALRTNLIVIYCACALLYPLGIAIAFFSFYRMGVRCKRKLQEEYLSGTRLASVESVNQRHVPSIQRANGQCFWFGGAVLPREELVTHFKIMGSTRSGKTTLLRLYMRSVLSRIGTFGCEDRALLYDPKSEFYPFLRGMGIPEDAIYILNPFDARGFAWNIARDFPLMRHASSLGAALLPEKPNSHGNPFFDKAGRRILSGLAKFFIRRAPGQWTLRDLVLGAQSLELVGLLAACDRRLRMELQQVMGGGETAQNVLATISANIGAELETIAAYTHHHQKQGRTFSLKDWFASSSVLLLGCDRESEATLGSYNQLLVTRFSELASSRAEPIGMTHAIFDEVPTLGAVGRRLEELARVGASYRISLVIVFQAYSSLRELYGENIANALVGQCDKSAFLRVLDRDSARWASEQLGETRLRRWTQNTNTSTSTSPGSFGVSTSSSSGEAETIVHEPVITPEDLMNLKKPSLQDKRGVMGFYKVGSDTYPYYLESDFISQKGVVDDPLSERFEEIPDPKAVEELEFWDQADIERLDIMELLESATEKQLGNLPLSDWVQTVLETAPGRDISDMNKAMSERDGDTPQM